MYETLHMRYHPDWREFPKNHPFKEQVHSNWNKAPLKTHFCTSICLIRPAKVCVTTVPTGQSLPLKLFIVQCLWSRENSLFSQIFLKHPHPPQYTPTNAIHHHPR